MFSTVIDHKKTKSMLYISPNRSIYFTTLSLGYPILHNLANGNAEPGVCNAIIIISCHWREGKKRDGKREYSVLNGGFDLCNKYYVTHLLVILCGVISTVCPRHLCSPIQGFLIG